MLKQLIVVLFSILIIATIMDLGSLYLACYFADCDNVFLSKVFFRIMEMAESIRAHAFVYSVAFIVFKEFF